MSQTKSRCADLEERRHDLTGIDCRSVTGNRWTSQDSAIGRSVPGCARTGLAHHEHMRVLTIQSMAMGVSAEQESNWPQLAADAVLAAEQGHTPVPTVWFETDAGAFGLIPISERTPVVFSDAEGSAGTIGTVVAMGPGTAPQT